MLKNDHKEHHHYTTEHTQVPLCPCRPAAGPLFVVLVLVVGPCPGGRGGDQVLRCVSEAEALGGVSQVEGADVEDVFEAGGVGGVGPQEGLQR